MCVWWRCKHYEFFKRSQTIDSNLCCEQLGRVKQKIIDNNFYNNNVILLQHNARPHVSKKTLKKLAEFGWEVYLPDLAPTDFYLFRSLQNMLDNKIYSNEDDLRKSVKEYFDSKENDFFEKGIFKLSNRWKEVMANNGNYVLN